MRRHSGEGGGRTAPDLDATTARHHYQRLAPRRRANQSGIGRRTVAEKAVNSTPGGDQRSPHATLLRDRNPCTAGVMSALSGPVSRGRSSWAR